MLSFLPHRRLRALLALPSLALALALPGCGGDSGAAPPPTHVAQAQAAAASGVARGLAGAATGMGL